MMKMKPNRLYFRVYHTKLNIISEPVSLNYLMGGGFLRALKINEAHPDDLVFLQSTGYRDIDNVIICEGDIIGGFHNPNAYYVVHFGHYDSWGDYSIDDMSGYGWYLKDDEGELVDFDFLYNNKKRKARNCIGKVIGNEWYKED